MNSSILATYLLLWDCIISWRNEWNGCLFQHSEWFRAHLRSLYFLALYTRSNIGSIVMDLSSSRWSTTSVGTNKSQWRKRDKPAKAAFLGHPFRLIGNSRANRQSFLCPSIRRLIDQDVKDSSEERSDNAYLSEPTSPMRSYHYRYPDCVLLNCFARQFSAVWCNKGSRFGESRVK